MTNAQPRGFCPPRFSAVSEAFSAHFDQGVELGARFSVAIEGEIVIDLIGGWADRAQTKPYEDHTLNSVFSTTKAMAALMIAKLVDQGRLSYDELAADVWPEFAEAGKAALTVGDLLSHQGGLCGFAEPMDPGLWFDFPAIARRLAAMAPLWPPGLASGYHPVTFGYLAEEIFRRRDGRSLGQAFHEDLAAPLGLDLWIGLPDIEHARCADMRRPPAMPALGEIDEIKRLAFFTPWASPRAADLATWRRAAIPSVTGHATAPALARMMSILARNGAGPAGAWLRPETVTAALAERRRGRDLVLPYDMSWAAGLIRNEGLWIYGPGRETVGHSGWGGSCAFADPEHRISGAYVMNRQSAELIADPRAKRLIEAAYAAL
jgi:CubicO group peptidase (beta-lactamase class C family)